MNTIKPIIGNSQERKVVKRLQSNKKGSNVSFKAVNPAKIVNPKSLLSAADKNVLNVFSQHYGKAGTFLIDKTDDLIKESKILEKSSRFVLDKGKMVIKDKSIPKSLFENVIFPFITLPLYAANWVIKKAQAVPFLKKGATALYDKSLFRVPRKLNHLNESTNQIKGILEKTNSTVSSFIKEKGLKMTTEELMEKLSKADDSPIVKEASDYVKENLYKASNKFFDKYTGNFNTAYERPLNRIVTGLIPVTFLANDAYNLAVLCGDSKEDCKKEANERRSQEISRVFTTAFIQLLTFGAFTKQVNTIPWFTPATSALTVLFSEISSRKRLGKPVFFLSKEKAKEYNEKEENKVKNEKKTKTINSTTAKDAPVKTQTPQISEKAQQTPKFITAAQSEPSIFASFKGTTKTEQANKDKEKTETKEKKALMNMDTFKKAVAIALAGSFAVSFLKNSSYTRNSKIMQAFKKFGETCKKKIYDPLAFKTFEMKTSEFDDLMKVLDDVGCKEIADGHRFIKDKYSVIGKSAADAASAILMPKHSISSEGRKKAIEQISTALKDIADDADIQKITESIKTALNLEKTAISEMKYDKVAQKATEIIKNKKVKLSEEQLQSLTARIAEAVEQNGSSSMIKVETKLKPFVDIVIEPFKFIKSAINLPFKIVTALTNLATSPVRKKAAEAALGKAELNNFEKAVNKVVTEIFGEASPKSKKISQEIFVNAMEQFKKKTEPYRKAKEILDKAVANGTATPKMEEAVKKAEDDLYKYINRAVQKSFDGVTQSSNKNTDLAMMTKLASSAVTSAFLVADNYNMVMIKSNGEDAAGAKEKANERIIQRLSALFYQTLFINWFNSTFRATYNSSLKGMTAVAIPNTLTTEIITRKSIGMPVGKKTYEELQEIDEKNESRKGFLGKYFKFMRLLTGKKPLKDRLPKDKQNTLETAAKEVAKATNTTSTNLLEIYAGK